MSGDKDDLFEADDLFEDALEGDDFFDEDPSPKPKPEATSPKKVKIPESAQQAAKEATPEVKAPEAKTEAPEPPAEPPVELPAEPPVEPPASKPEPAKKAPAKPRKAAAKDPSAKKAAKPLTPKQKAVNNMMRKAGLNSDDAVMPTLEHLLRGKQGTKVKISDIAVFIKKPEDEILADLFQEMPVLNRVNLSTCVDLGRVKVVGGEVLSADRMYQPIQVARIAGDGRLECTSGRHRLVSLALLFGPHAEIPVYIEDMTINEARDAVVVANMARKAKAMEKAEHAALAAVGGDVDAEQDVLYDNMVTTKANAKKYCTFSVLERSRPLKLKFAVGSTKEGGLATINTLEGFWGAALAWHKGMPRKDFDRGLKASIEFLNSLSETFQADEGFDSDQHMASMVMAAIGKYYKAVADTGDVDQKVIEDIAAAIMAMGEIGRQKSETTYANLCKAMKKK